MGFDQDLKQPLNKKMSATQSHEVYLRIRCCHAKAVLLNIECTIGYGSINTSQMCHTMTWIVTDLALTLHHIQMPTTWLSSMISMSSLCLILRPLKQSVFISSSSVSTSKIIMINHLSHGHGISWHTMVTLMRRGTARNVLLIARHDGTQRCLRKFNPDSGTGKLGAWKNTRAGWNNYRKGCALNASEALLSYSGHTALPKCTKDLSCQRRQKFDARRSLESRTVDRCSLNNSILQNYCWQTFQKYLNIDADQVDSYEDSWNLIQQDQQVCPKNVVF